MEEIEGYSRGIVSDRNRLYWEEFKQIPSPYPPIEEQNAIVRYLNEKLAQVDLFIANKKNIIRLLETQLAVSIDMQLRGQGLKEHSSTGVAWCPSLPKGYSIERLRFMIGYQEGPGIMAADFRNRGVPLLRISCVKGERATLEGCNFLDPEMVAAKWSHFKVRRGDYLISASASFGSMCQVDEEAEGAIPYTGLIRLWPRRNDVLMEYVKLFMRSKMFLDQIELLKAGTAIQHFGPTHLGRMHLVLPSTEDQKGIVASITALSKSIEEQVVSLDREIELINEFRASLIAEAVTGKIDVQKIDEASHA